MPIYDYACSACAHRFEVVHGVHDPGPVDCPSCGSGPVRKAFAAPAVLFKGSGWAKMDRRSTPGASKAKSTGTDESTPATSGTAEPKPASAGSDAASTASTAPTTTTSTSAD